MNNIVLLLTGTIAPQNVPNLLRNNLNDRENDYYEAIKKWMTLDIPIVFCENSNFDSVKINSLFNTNNKHEYLKFKTSVSHLGKGNGEAEIFEYAFSKSNILKRAIVVCKITGRYNIRNFESIRKKLFPQNFDVSANLSRNLTWADTRLFFFKPAFYFDFLCYSLMFLDEDKKIYFEHCLAKAIHKGMSEKLEFQMLPELPIFIGVYGSGNVKYKTSIFTIIKYKVYSKLKLYFFKHGS